MSVKKRLFYRPRLRRAWLERMVHYGNVGDYGHAIYIEPCDHCGYEVVNEWSGVYSFYAFDRACPFCGGEGWYYLRPTRRQRSAYRTIVEQLDKWETRVPDLPIYHGCCRKCGSWTDVLARSEVCIRCHFGDRLVLWADGKRAGGENCGTA